MKDNKKAMVWQIADLRATYKSCPEGSKIVENGNTNCVSELPSARGRRFAQPFTNNFALQSITI